MVPLKPHPFVNVWNTISYSLYWILFHMKFVEGKDWPPQLPGPTFDGHGKVVILLIQIMWMIWHTGTCVFLDSGLLVLKGIT